jgi:hypothetical protein
MTLPSNSTFEPVSINISVWGRMIFVFWRMTEAGPYSGFFCSSTSPYLQSMSRELLTSTIERSFEASPMLALVIVVFSTMRCDSSPPLIPLSSTSSIRVSFILIWLPEKSMASFPILVKTVFDTKPVLKSESKASPKIWSKVERSRWKSERIMLRASSHWLR